MRKERVKFARTIVGNLLSDARRKVRDAASRVTGLSIGEDDVEASRRLIFIGIAQEVEDKLELMLAWAFSGDGSGEDVVRMRLAIPLEALRTMPPGRPLGVERVRDQFGVEHEAVRWVFQDRQGPVRVAYFDLRTGEYLTDAI